MVGPRYFKHRARFKDARYVRRDPDGKYLLVDEAGKERPAPFLDHEKDTWIQDGWWVEITQVEALALLDVKIHSVVEWNDRPEASKEVDVW